MDAARHCCVCRRYKGVKVEVHHIVSQSNRGSDDSDNAIALCFDCHADAGHYNLKHPRGTKFSAGELRLARDEWHEHVQCQGVQPGPVNDAIYSRYLICKSAAAAAEVLAGDFTRAPFTEPVLAHGPVRAFQEKMVQIIGGSDQPEEVCGDFFETVEDFRTAQPTARVFEEVSDSYYPYYRSRRLPGLEEILKRVAPEDTVTALLLECGFDPAEICLALAYDDVCGGGGFQEIYRLRPLWFVFFELRNVGDLPLQLRELSGKSDMPLKDGGRPFGKFRVPSDSTVELPAPPVLPGQSVVVPVAVLLGPLNKQLPTALHTEEANLTTEQLQVVEHQDFSQLIDEVAVIGPAFWPSELISVHGHPLGVHDLNLANIYTLDRVWEVGSCPHLFFVHDDGSKVYASILFGAAQGVEQRESFVVPKGVTALEIAELEREKTVLMGVWLDGRLVMGHTVLLEGEAVQIDVSPGVLVEAEGLYESDMRTPRRARSLELNRLVVNHLSGSNDGPSGTSASQETC